MAKFTIGIGRDGARVSLRQAGGGVNILIGGICVAAVAPRGVLVSYEQMDDASIDKLASLGVLIDEKTRKMVVE